jgi:hydrogenase maturation protein HypF
MEALVDPGEKEFYPFDIYTSSESIRIDPTPVIQAVVQDHRTCTPMGIIAARFHAGVAEMVLRAVLAIRKMSQVSEVALSGGVWQNIVLLRMTLKLLQSNGFTVFVNRQVPCNDGGLALGQVVIAGKFIVGGSHVSGHSR